VLGDGFLLVRTWRIGGVNVARCRLFFNNEKHATFLNFIFGSKKQTGF
jgi:hypothetical protein